MKGIVIKEPVVTKQSKVINEDDKSKKKKKDKIDDVVDVVKKLIQQP